MGTGRGRRVPFHPLPETARDVGARQDLRDVARLLPAEFRPCRVHQLRVRQRVDGGEGEDADHVESPSIGAA